MLVEEKDAKLKELGNILERKQLLSKGKFEEKVKHFFNICEIT